MCGLKAKPAFNHAILLSRRFCQHPPGRLNCVLRGGYHRADRITALQGDDVPGKGDQIAPVAFITKEREGRGDNGIGPHYCLGAPLALLEDAIGMAILLARLPNLRLHPGYPTAPYRHEFRATPTLYVQG